MNGLQHLLSAPMQELLVSGSDTRSAIDEKTGLNSYGCTPSPRPGALSFGSSTASTISRRAFRHVECRREHLLKRLAHPNELDALTENLREALRRLFGLEATGTEIVLSPSGTDSTLHGLFLARALHGDRPMDTILAAADETGSSVGMALSGRHFSPLTAGGTPVIQGAPIAGLSNPMPLIPIAVRRPDGRLHDPATLDQAVINTIERSVQQGHRVLLQVMDSSKLGVRCPSTRALQEIQSRFGESVRVVVDACQMRISRARLQWYLEQGYIVLISGSKFFTGPPFSGALLIPPSLSHAIQQVRDVPEGLKDYTSRSSWPQAWPDIRTALPDRPNFGQYFRWAAAITEMRDYFSIPGEFRRAALAGFASLTAGLIQDRALRMLDEWPGQPDDIDDIEDEEMSERTIFPFLVGQGSAWMSFQETVRLYQALNRNSAETLPRALSRPEKRLASKICHIGQPVRIAFGNGTETGAMRICASARTVTRLWARNRRHLLQQMPVERKPFELTSCELNLEREQGEVATILSKIALISRLGA